MLFKRKIVNEEEYFRITQAKLKSGVVFSPLGCGGGGLVGTPVAGGQQSHVTRRNMQLNMMWLN